MANIGVFDYGNVARNVSQIQNRNAITRNQLDPNSLDNQYRQAQINAVNYPAGSIDPTAHIQNYEYYMGLSPEDRKQFDNIMRAQQIKMVGGVQSQISPTGTVNPLGTIEAEVGAKRQLAAGTETGKQEVKTKFEPARAAAIESAKFEQKKKNLQPKQIGAASAAQDRTTSLKELVAQARTQANAFTTGWVGDKTKDIAGTPSHDLSQTLLTLQANAGFDRLQEMRNNSVTGGALGQVSERELGLLMAAYAALEQSQSKGQFLQNLSRFEKQVDQSWKRVKLAYRLDYGEEYKEPIKPDENGSLGDMSLEDLKAMEAELLK